MASLFTKCCCTGNCFWGWNSLGVLGDDYGYCSHNSSERLYLRIPRPGFSTKNVVEWPATQGCCSGDALLVNTATGANDIIVKYAHFPGESGSRLYNWKWYQPIQCLPPCTHTCWGFEAVGFSDIQCCDTNDPVDKRQTCQDAWFMPHPTSSGNFNAAYLSKAQRDVCKGIPLSQIGNPANSAGVASSKQFGDGFRWWENISNYQTGSRQDRFKKYWYTTETGWIAIEDKKLVETMFVVLHRTKWWKRDFNSLHPNDCIPADCLPGAVASCRTPEYWDYECAGFPIYTWEVYNAPSNVLSESEKQAMFVAVDNGNGFDHEAMDRLVAHLGCEPKDHGRETGETVKRTLVDQDGDETVHYAFSREAGWLNVCYDKDTADKFPQWTTNLTDCNSPPGNFSNCFTAGPFPQETTCQSSNGKSGPSHCNGISACNSGAGSPPCPVLAADCDGTNPPTGCRLDSAIGDCSGIWFHYNQYCFTTPAQNYLINYACCIHNEAFLCVVPDANSECDCSTLPFYGPLHPVPPGVSAHQRKLLADGRLPIDMDQCCGGRGTFAPAPPGTVPYCDRCSNPNTQVCKEPEESPFCPTIGTP